MQENADLVSQIMALRVELTMRVVMPAVVPHSQRYPYMCMARFETGAGGNPRAHGFSVGLPGPRMGRVHADVDGAEGGGRGGDLPPSIVAEDVAVLLRWLWQDGGAADWESRGDLLRGEAEELVRGVLEAAEAALVGGGALGSGAGGGVEGAGAARGGDGLRRGWRGRRGPRGPGRRGGRRPGRRGGRAHGRWRRQWRGR